MALRDISAIMNDAQIEQLKALLAGQPSSPVAPGEYGEYPKILYREEWWVCEKVIRDSEDDLAKKLARERQRRYQLIVKNPMEEEKRAYDGWISDINDFIVKDTGKDPRVPEGYEAVVAAQDREDAERTELERLRIRFAQLTKKSIDVEFGGKPPATADEPTFIPRPQVARATPTTRRGVGAAQARERVKQAAAEAVV